MISYSNDLIGSIEDISISDIVLPAIPLRTEMNDLEELADSINKVGLLNPIVVRTNSMQSFEIVAGNRRFNACKKLGWRKIPCHVVEMDDKLAFEVSMIENVQRQTLNPIDEGFAFRKYVDKYGWGGVTELSQKLSKSPSYVSKRMKLIELPKDVIELISKSEINVSIAEELLSIPNHNDQSKLAIVMRDDGLSSRDARNLVRHYGNYPDIVHTYSSYGHHYIYVSEKICKSFDKSIIALRITTKKIARIAEALEDDWIFYNILLHHKNMLNSQIDILIREKRKYKRGFSLGS
jgi:ParB family chromosome partitioning protein